MRVLVLLFSTFSGVAVFSAGVAAARPLLDNEIAADRRPGLTPRANRSTLSAGVARVLLGECGLNRLRRSRTCHPSPSVAARSAPQKRSGWPAPVAGSVSGSAPVSPPNNSGWPSRSLGPPRSTTSPNNSGWRSRSLGPPRSAPAAGSVSGSAPVDHEPKQLGMAFAVAGSASVRPRSPDPPSLTGGAAATRATPWRAPAQSRRPRHPAACLARSRAPQSASGAPGPASSSRETRAVSDAATAAGF